VQQDTLGSFHTELLEFLQRGLKERCGEVSGDPNVREGALPLAEIIESYQHLFGAKESILLEKTLLESFPAKDFVELGLTRSFPRVYRGLPRLYHRNYPTQSMIKKDFTYLPSLKRVAATKALYSLYGKIPVQGKVTIFTWVLGDGLGDYVAAKEFMSLIRARLPDVDVHLVALVHAKSVPYLPQMAQSLIVPYEKECPLSLIPQEALELLRSSDLILVAPTFYPHTNELIETLAQMRPDHPMPKLEMIGEYGFGESGWFHPKSGGHAMGLHFLEKGILIRRPLEAKWEDVQNEQLLKWRWAENRFYLAYLTTPIGGAVYLHSLLKSLENDPLGVDLCVPDLGWFVKYIDQQNKAGRPILEWDIGVGSIDVYYQDQIHTIALASEGKKVRILCPGVISLSDFRALLALSEGWVAVRGNQSFSEVVSQGKPFFYDGRGHSCYFMKDLAALAENRIADFPAALTCLRGMNQAFHYNLPVQEGEWVDETYFQDCEEWTSVALGIGLALQDPELGTGFARLNQILREEYSVNHFICHLVQRALHHRAHPELERLEALELALFASNSQSFREMIEALR
jgi:hypothetical protein